MNLGTPLRGIFVPVVTPFTDDGADLDIASLVSLAGGLIDGGATGLVASSTTGEAATLSAAERSVVLRTCAEICRDRGVPLLAGAGSAGTSAGIDALGALAGSGVTAALVPVPPFVRPGEAGVVAHFLALADASPVPLVIYNVPYRTGQPITAGALLELARHPRICAVKHAVGAVDADTLALLADAPSGFAVLGGDDVFMPALFALGSPGGILASAHLDLGGYRELLGLWTAGDVPAARALGHRLARLAAAAFAAPNPTLIKAVLHRQGRIAWPAARLPLLPAPDHLVDQLIDLLDAPAASPALTPPEQLEPAIHDV